MNVCSFINSTVKLNLYISVWPWVFGDANLTWQLGYNLYSSPYLLFTLNHSCNVCVMSSIYNINPSRSLISYTDFVSKNGMDHGSCGGQNNSCMTPISDIQVHHIILIHIHL